MGGVLGEINPVSGQILAMIKSVDHHGGGVEYYHVVNGAGVTNIFRWTIGEGGVDSVADADWAVKETYSRLIHVEESDKLCYDYTNVVLLYPSGWQYDFCFPIGMTNDAPAGPPSGSSTIRTSTCTRWS